MARLKSTPRSIGHHPKYHENPQEQKIIEEGVDAQFHAIMDLVEVVVHKRLTQFAEVLAEKINQP